MKKLLTVILILAMILPAAALADLPDISGLSYDELVELKDQINIAMWNSKEWQEVTVPVGIWKVGEDIPEGRWSITITPDTNAKWASIKYCDRLNETGTDAGNMFLCDVYEHLDVAAQDNERYPQFIDITVKSGMYIVIGNAPVVFTPYAGKPDLGFH